MNLPELKAIVARGESENVEFKRSTGQLTEGARTICAMLNGLGGFVLFGVKDSGEVTGQDVADQTLRDVAQEIRKIEPPAFPDLETVALDSGRAVLAVRVSGSRPGPYRFDGRPYIRHGTTTILMPQDEYDRRLMEKLHGTRRWENEPVAGGVGVKDLDGEEIRRAVDTAVAGGRLRAMRQRKLEDLLRGLGLIVNGKLINAAVALFGKNPELQAHYPQLALRVARFRGTDRLADFADNRQYWGHAFDLLGKAASFLLDHIPVAGKVVPGRMRREDRPAYAPRATREALANAFCHRDYAMGGGAVTVALYDDHLEIANPGALHFGITPEKLLQPHESRPWNPIIAEVFHRTEIIEKFGSGTLNILEWCRENGNPAPTWQVDAGTVLVAFKPRVAVPSARVTDQVTDQDKRRAERGLGGDLVAGQVTVQVAVQVLRLCEQPQTAVAIQELVKIRHRPTFRANYLDPLLARRWLEMTVPEKPNSRLQRYRLTAKGRAWLETQCQ